MAEAFVFYRSIGDYSYKELVEKLCECDLGPDDFDWTEAANWLEEIIAANLHKRSEIAEDLKKAAHLALYLVDLAFEPGKGFAA
jgi:hypothetical protein